MVGGKEVVQNRSWAPYSGCYECGMPQSVCESFRRDEERGGHFKQRNGVRCQYEGVLIGVLGAIWTRYGDEMELFIQHAMGLVGNLNKPVDLGGACWKMETGLATVPGGVDETFAPGIGANLTS